MRHALEQAELVGVRELGQRRDVAVLARRPQAPDVVHRHVERLHQVARVGGEALLARDQRVAMVEIFLLPLIVDRR